MFIISLLLMETGVCSSEVEMRMMMFTDQVPMDMIPQATSK
jgi:hypothetical protein